MTVSFNSLKLSLSDAITHIEWEDQIIEIKTYLPVNDKLELISWIINQSADELKFYNVGKLKVFVVLGIVKYYTNIKFTDKQLSNPTKIYDLLINSKLYDKILFGIPEEEYEWIITVLKDTVESIYKYQNSVFGILDAVTTDYKNLNFDVSELKKNISNPENLTLLKDVVTKLG